MYVIEVQHSSDTKLDGKWYTIDTAESEEQAAKLVEYFGTEKPIPAGLRPEECRITGSYAGRPLRYRAA